MKHCFDIGLLVLRVGISALMLKHGIPKIAILFNSPIRFPDPLGVGNTFSLILTLIGEVVAPILIIIGFKTRIVSLFPTITMLVAAFVIHLNDPFGKKEIAILYLIGFLTLVFTGAGKYSVDGRNRNHR